MKKLKMFDFAVGIARATRTKLVVELYLSVALPNFGHAPVTQRTIISMENGKPATTPP
jgi:hypothetical protein